MKKEELFKFIRFIIVGGSGSVVSLGVLYLFTSCFHVYYLLSNCVAFICAVTNNYCWNSLWSFHHFSMASGYFKYLLISLFALGLSTGLMYLFTTKLGIYYIISGILTIVCIAPVNFTLSRIFVWGKG